MSECLTLPWQLPRILNTSDIEIFSNFFTSQQIFKTLKMYLWILSDDFLKWSYSTLSCDAGSFHMAFEDSVLIEDLRLSSHLSGPAFLMDYHQWTFVATNDTKLEVIGFYLHKHQICRFELWPRKPKSRGNANLSVFGRSPRLISSLTFSSAACLLPVLCLS